MFTTRTEVVVRGALDGLAARHRAYLENVANVDTPGFQPRDVPFEAQLREVRDSLAGQPAGVGEEPVLSLDAVAMDQDADRTDGNGVQIDEQMMRLAENTLRYEALAQAERLRNELLRSAVTEGRR